MKYAFTDRDTALQYLNNHDHIAYSGRIETFLEHPERQTLPSSCRVEKYKNNLPATLWRLSAALRMGAGINVILDDWKPLLTAATPPPQISYYCNADHPDFGELLAYFQSRGEADRLMTDNRHRPQAARILVNDSMEEDAVVELASIEKGSATRRRAESISETWGKTYTYLLAQIGIEIDLSLLRPRNTTNAVGLVASGPLSFLSIYERIFDYIAENSLSSLMRLMSQLCDVLRRGGSYKNGIITYSLTYRRQDIFAEYLDLDLSTLPGGSKQGARLDGDAAKDPVLLERLAEAINKKSLFLEKIYGLDGDGEELFSNVCREVLMRAQGSCLMAHANAGKARTPAELIPILVDTTEFTLNLHAQWRSWVDPRQAELYLPPDKDRQIGVGWIGWANFLAAQGVTYEDHVRGLEQALGLQSPPGLPPSLMAQEIAQSLIAAYAAAAALIKNSGLGHLIERAFTMAPTQRLWVDERNKDLRGHYACRSIDPPFARREFRRSQTQATEQVFYHGSVETMKDVGHDCHQRHWECWMRIIQSTGMAQTMSFDRWNAATPEWVEDFLTRSPLTTTYYAFLQTGAQNQPDQAFANKGQVQAARPDPAPLSPPENEQACLISDPDCQSCGN